MFINPCQDCGACCASFRVSFYWGETTALQEHGVPEMLTEKLNHHRVVMLGTNQVKPQCISLHGTIGKTVSCNIYERRPEPCRDFTAGNDRCLVAREKHGLDNSLFNVTAACA